MKTVQLTGLWRFSSDGACSLVSVYTSHELAESDAAIANVVDSKHEYRLEYVVHADGIDV